MTWWTISEACVWIDWRDDEGVTGMPDRMRLWLPSPGSPLEVEMRELLAAAGKGDIEITGRLRGEGSPVVIDRVEWFRLELTRDYPGGRDGGRARRRSDGDFGLSFGGDWWDTLRVDADAVRKHWPPKKEKAPDAEPVNNDEAIAWLATEARKMKDAGEKFHRPAKIFALLDKYKDRGLTRDRANEICTAFSKNPVSKGLKNKPGVRPGKKGN